ncbi:glycerophosphodiester phosphodiesterase family protein [uncultured Alistipes sp.]|jgi:glycerophosphodiester phosphodiesterase|uniref:glycerophosphodiester phosphodiesterase n=1 Tax=uncultured Alistipes sp. TaxID=538949 RepID=UPI0025E67680|nr:glycerophosphodiester phosphodiesterase family protein [uncultured Alistipes sp.]
MKKLKYLLGACCAVITLSLGACSDDDYEPLPDWWWDQGGEEVVYPEPEAVDNRVCAHRGAWKEYSLPNNSIAALQKAIDLRCFASECDIHITKDGKVVVYHDNTYYGLIFKDATYEELRAKGKLPNGEELPLFEDYLQKVLDGGCTQLWVDVKSLDDEYGGNSESIKAGIAAAEIVHEMRARNFVGFLIGRLAVYESVVRYVRSEWPVAYMNTAYTPDQFINKNMTWANFDILKVGLDNAKAKSYTDKGIRLSLYQIDTDEQMQWYKSVQSNVYGITNMPTKLLQELGVR